jgi:hypothetical protein
MSPGEERSSSYGRTQKDERSEWAKRGEQMRNARPPRRTES